MIDLIIASLRSTTSQSNQDDIYRQAALYTLATSLALIGVLPRIPVFHSIETRCRSYLQNRAVAFGAVNRLSDKIKSAHPISTDTASDITTAPIDNDQDTVLQYPASSPRFTERYWARFATLAQALEILRDRVHDDQYSRLTRCLSVEMLERYSDERDTILATYTQLRNDLSSSVQQSPTGEEAESVSSSFNSRRDIDEAFDKCCILISCAILAKGNQSHSEEDILEALGFQSSIDNVSATRYLHAKKDINVLSWAIALAIFLSFVVAAFASGATHVPGFPTSRACSSWPHQINSFNGIAMLIILLFVHAAPVGVAVWLRLQYLRREAWFSGTSGVIDIPTFGRYFIVGVVAIEVGVLFSTTWDFLIESPEGLGSPLPGYLIEKCEPQVHERLSQRLENIEPSVFFQFIQGLELYWKQARDFLGPFFYTAPSAVVSGVIAFFVLIVLDLVTLFGVRKWLFSVVLVQVPVVGLTQWIMSHYYFHMKGEVKLGAVGYSTTVVVLFSTLLLLSFSFGKYRIDRRRHAKGDQPEIG